MWIMKKYSNEYSTWAVLAVGFQDESLVLEGTDFTNRASAAPGHNLEAKKYSKYIGVVHDLPTTQ